MASLLENIKETQMKLGLRDRSRASRVWLQSKFKSLSYRPGDLLRYGGNKNLISPVNFIPGEMYFYYYDPKGKHELPFYDKFPLCMPVERYEDGFLGLNLHYIYPPHRAMLLDKLIEFAPRSPGDRMKLSYDLLSGSAKYGEFKPCVKRYLYNHFQTRLLKIDPSEWDIVCYLPFERFVGRNKTSIWQDTHDEIKGVAKRVPAVKQMTAPTTKTATKQAFHP